MQLHVKTFGHLQIKVNDCIVGLYKFIPLLTYLLTLDSWLID